MNRTRRSATCFINVVVVFSLVQFSGCFDHKVTALPPATTTGERTIGFLLNGELWVPQGKLLDQKIEFSYDWLGGGHLWIGARRFGDGPKEYFDIVADSVTSTGTYSFTAPPSLVNCQYLKTCGYDDTVTDFFQTGVLNITKLDLATGIVSGTFEITIAVPLCDTLRITEGRFDMKP